MRAFQPQNPRPIDANATLHKNAKGPPPALVDTEGLLRLDGTMGTGPAVARLFSGFQFFRVVLDFLFCCHNLEMNLHMGDAPRSFNGLVRPLFSFPQSGETLRSSARQKNGAGSHFEKHEGGVQAGMPRRRGTVSKRNETKKQSPSQIIWDLAAGIVSQSDCHSAAGC